MHSAIVLKTRCEIYEENNEGIHTLMDRSQRCLPFCIFYELVNAEDGCKIETGLDVGELQTELECW